MERRWEVGLRRIDFVRSFASGTEIRVDGKRIYCRKRLPTCCEGYFHKQFRMGDEHVAIVSTRGKADLVTGERAEHLDWDYRRSGWLICLCFSIVAVSVLLVGALVRNDFFLAAFGIPGAAVPGICAFISYRSMDYCDPEFFGAS
jgi:hypothetical protein